MTINEKRSLMLLYAVFALFILLMVTPYIGLDFLDRIIVIAFYGLGISVPLYFLIRFLFKRTMQAFKVVVIAALPMFLFSVFMIVLFIQLGNSLDHF